MFVNELYQGGIRALLAWDNTIFDGLIVPEGILPSDVIDHIVYKYGDAPLFSPDPSVIKFYINRWSKRRLPLWERYKEVIEVEYNPIENYDRMENGKNILENLISADNVSAYQPDNKSISEVELRTHGNIGVTTAATMQEEILDLIPRFDLIDYIADDFQAEFCLMMYN